MTSDADDEIHAHTGGTAMRCGCQAGTPAKGSFTIDSPGSFEVESHHLEQDHRDLERALARASRSCSYRCMASRRGTTCRCRSPSSWSAPSLALVISFAVLIFAWRTPRFHAVGGRGAPPADRGHRPSRLSG